MNLGKETDGGSLQKARHLPQYLLILLIRAINPALSCKQNVFVRTAALLFPPERRVPAALIVCFAWQWVKSPAVPGSRSSLPPPEVCALGSSGDYELLSELARGGMGVIYRARQISLNRTVALKMIQPGQMESPEAWLRFQTEIAASAQLDHPNIVSLHESGTVDWSAFLHDASAGGWQSCNPAGSRADGAKNRRGLGAPWFRQTREAIAGMMIKVARPFIRAPTRCPPPGSEALEHPARRKR